MIADFLQFFFSGLTLWFEASKLEVEVDPSQGKIKHHNHTQNHQKKSFQDLDEDELSRIEERIGLKKYFLKNHGASTLELEKANPFKDF